MPQSHTSSASKAQHYLQDDLHRLIGQIIDHRLRVIGLHYVSPHQWLYQVEPPSVGKTRRALKVLGDPLAREPGSFYRLKTSYERLKRVESSHVERVYESGLLHDLTPYVLVSWEPHVSLYEHLRRLRKPLAWREAQPMLINLCEGISALHKAGVAHGDIRAQHVLLRKPPQDPLLIDACISSSFGAPPTPGLEKSWAYWAPERHNLSTSTTASDMYSFGVLIYLCLHNQLPFSPLHDTEYAKRLKRGDIIAPARWLEEAHLSGEPNACSPRLPPELTLLIKRLLSKTPRSRPTAVEALSVLRGELSLDELSESFMTTLDEPDPDDAITSVDPDPVIADIRSMDSETTSAYSSALTESASSTSASVITPARLALWTILSGISVTLGILLSRL